MKIELSRLEQVGEYTIGELRVDDQWLCWTLEDRVRTSRIKDATAIPAGTYAIRLTRSERLREVVPEIIGIPREFGRVRLHGGLYSNPNADMSSSILLGLDKKGDEIRNHRRAYNKLMYRFEGVSRETGASIKITQPDAWPKWGDGVKVDTPLTHRHLRASLMMYLLKLFDLDTILGYVALSLDRLRKSPADARTRSHLVMVNVVRDSADDFINAVQKPW